MRRTSTEGSWAERVRLWMAVRRRGATIRAPFRLPHPPRDSPSKRVVLEPGAYLGPRAWIVLGPRGRLTVGRDTAIGESFGCSVSSAVDIGPGCLLSARVFIVDAQHDYEGWTRSARAAGEDPSMNFELGDPQPVEIGAGSWLGVGVVVMPGVRIGRGCVIGANSVVTASVDDFTVVAGNPARPIER